jgi:hypothetical protein
MSSGLGELCAASAKAEERLIQEGGTRALGATSAIRMADAMIADLEQWWQQQGENMSLATLHQQWGGREKCLGHYLIEKFGDRFAHNVLSNAGHAISECLFVKALAEDDVLSEGGAITANELWFLLNEASWRAGALFALTGAEPKNHAQEMAKLRHKDNHADRDFIQQWYRENRDLYPSKDAAATDAKEQRLVDQEWRTIRGYLNNV